MPKNAKKYSIKITNIYNQKLRYHIIETSWIKKVFKACFYKKSVIPWKI